MQIEVKFAQLRDQLYVERMDELTREEGIILDGTWSPVPLVESSISDGRGS